PIAPFDRVPHESPFSLTSHAPHIASGSSESGARTSIMYFMSNTPSLTWLADLHSPQQRTTRGCPTPQAPIFGPPSRTNQPNRRAQLIQPAHRPNVHYERAASEAMRHAQRAEYVRRHSAHPLSALTHIPVPTSSRPHMRPPDGEP